MEKTLEILEDKIIELENNNKELLECKENFLKLDKEYKVIKEENESIKWKLAKSIYNTTDKKLPVPRLEMVFIKINDSDVNCIYGLVKRSVSGDIIFYPMSKTFMRSSEHVLSLENIFKENMSNVTKEEISKKLPFRAGFDFEFDGVNLNLPMYVTYNNFYYEYKLLDNEIEELKEFNKKISKKGAK